MCSNSSARLFSLNTTTRIFHAVSCPRASVLSFPRLLPVSPVPVPYCFLADPCLSCARALLLPRQCSASSASRSTAPSITSCLPNPVFFRLDPRVLPPSLQGSFRLYLASFRLVPRVFFPSRPRVFSSRTPCPLVLPPGFFRPQPRVISSPIPELSFVCFRNLLLQRKRFSC